jgi:hypothetical protein
MPGPAAVTKEHRQVRNYLLSCRRFTVWHFLRRTFIQFLILPAAYLKAVLVLFPSGKTTPDVTLGFVNIQNDSGPGR